MGYNAVIFEECRSISGLRAIFHGWMGNKSIVCCADSPFVKMGPLGFVRPSQAQ